MPTRSKCFLSNNLKNIKIDNRTHFLILELLITPYQYCSSKFLQELQIILKINFSVENTKQSTLEIYICFYVSLYKKGVLQDDKNTDYN